MSADLCSALRQVVLDKGHIHALDVDVSFDLPTRDWIDGLVRPTLNFTLIDMTENLTFRSMAMQTVKANARAELRMPPRRVDLRYLVTAFTTDHGDSQRLLWRAMVALMRTPELPPVVTYDSDDYVDEELPLQLRTAQPDNAINALEVWGAIGAEARPSFTCSVTVPVDLNMTFDEPLVLTRGTQYQRTDKRPDVEYFDIGGVVRDSAGQLVKDVTLTIDGRADDATTDDRGNFVLRHIARGRLELKVLRPGGRATRYSLAVPASTYDIQLTS